MTLQPSADGSDPARPVGRAAGRHEHLRRERSTRLATGTLACPACDAPVVPAGPMSPAAPLACPFCEREGAVRDFLSLAAPSRPARVEVRVVERVRPRMR